MFKQSVAIGLALSCSAVAQAQWRVSTLTDEMTDKVTTMATVRSRFLKGDPTALLSVYWHTREDGATIVRHEQGSLACGRNCQVRVRFDAEPPEIFDAQGLVAGGKGAVSILGSGRLLERIQAANTVKIEVDVAGQGPAVFTFDTRGLALSRP